MLRDWLHQLCFVNINACKNTQDIYFILLYFRKFRRKINAKITIFFTFILFRIKCADGVDLSTMLGQK